MITDRRLKLALIEKMETYKLVKLVLDGKDLPTKVDERLKNVGDRTIKEHVVFLKRGSDFVELGVFNSKDEAKAFKAFVDLRFTYTVPFEYKNGRAGKRMKILDPVCKLYEHDCGGHIDETGKLTACILQKNNICHHVTTVHQINTKKFDLQWVNADKKLIETIRSFLVGRMLELIKFNDGIEKFNSEYLESIRLDFTDDKAFKQAMRDASALCGEIIEKMDKLINGK